jgi:malonyl CoA-acyl carrier protein transacylase
MSLGDAARVVAARGRLMADMPSGGMATVFAEAETIAPLLPASVEIAAFNGPALCTIAGPAAALEEALRQLAEARIESRRLRTSHAFHTAMMQGALVPFTAVLAQVSLSPPTIPYVSNVTGTWITAEQATSPAYYADHLRRPVQFAAGMKTLAVDPSLFYLELGPGQSLCTLARANLPSAQAALVAASLPPAGAAADDLRSLRTATGRLWLTGVATLPPAVRRRRVPLPTYPFQRKRYCAGSAARNSREDRGRVRCYVPAWVRDDAVPTLALRGLWVLIGARGAHVVALQTLLDVTGCQSISCAPGEPLTRVLQGRTPTGVIMLMGLETPSAPGSGRRLYRALVELAGELERLPTVPQVQVLVATCGTRSVLDESVDDREAVLVAGPALALPAELSWMAVRAVDLPTAAADVQAALLIRELRVNAGGSEIAWRGGRRWRRRFDAVELPAHAPTLRDDGYYLITGGLGGIGLSLAAWLASHQPSVRLLLTSRRCLPADADPDDPALPAWARTAARTILAIEVAGGRVSTAAVDVGDLSAMRAALADAAARFGPVRGVIHAAGNAGSGRLTVLQDDDQTTLTLAPKVQGLAVLTELLGGQALDFVALMSSINAVAPAAGVSDYAAANMVLDNFAEAAVHPTGWRHVFSINWSAWAGVGMAASLQVPVAQRAAHDALLRTAIAPAAGVEMFGRILGSSYKRVMVTSFDLETALQAASASEIAVSPPPSAGVAADAASVPDEAPRPNLTSRYEAPRPGAESAIAQIFTELMGVSGIGANDDFFELGGHSLLATRVLSRISQTLGMQLTLRAFFDTPTPRGLAAKFGPPVNHSATTDDVGSEREEFLL